MAKEELMLTPEGYKQLEEELRELKGPKRKALAERLKTAISYGDLRENSEYHSAKEEQAFMETRILQLERMLRTAKVINPEERDTGTIHVGSAVLLHDLEFDETIEYRIVSPAEADVNENKISYESPLGKELIGKKPGDQVSVHAPMGIIQYKVLEIRE